MSREPERPLSDIVGTLEIGYRLELAMAELYQVLGKVHHHHTQISSLWRKTAREEEQHAAQFRLAMSHARAMICEVAVDGRDAQQMLDAIEALARRYQANPPTIPEALRSAVRLEESLAQLHVDRACRFANAAHQRLFEAMLAADQEHVGSLQEALRTCDPSNRPHPELAQKTHPAS
jgi:rubrerythrin